MNHSYQGWNVIKIYDRQRSQEMTDDDNGVKRWQTTTTESRDDKRRQQSQEMTNDDNGVKRWQTTPTESRDDRRRQRSQEMTDDNSSQEMTDDDNGVKRWQTTTTESRDDSRWQWSQEMKNTHMTGSCIAFINDNTYRGLSWPWTYGSWIYNYLCNQCRSPLMLWLRISCDKFVGDLRQVGGLLHVLRFPPSIKLATTLSLKYCWKWR
jgi:hypothetical protein